MTYLLSKKILPIMMLSFLLNGCLVGPQFKPPSDSKFPNTVFALRDDKTGAPHLQTQPVPATWWTLFHDPLLNSLEFRAVKANLDIQAASTRIAQSRAKLGIASASLFPQLNANAGYTREALSKNGPLGALGAPFQPYNLWQAGFLASWEIDLWGHARRIQERAGALTQVNIYARDGIQVSISSEVAHEYVLLRGAQAQLDILNQNQKIALHILDLIKIRQRNGVATRFDTATAHSQVAAINAIRMQVLHRRNTIMNALSLLLAEPPQSLDKLLVKAKPIPSMAHNLPIGLSSELAHRRPDILQAEARLHEATAAIGVAETNFYPRVNLIGSLGLQSLEHADLVGWSSRQFFIGPAVYLPIFQGGRIINKLALTKAHQQEVAIAYRRTVLNAWHEINNALDAYSTELQRRKELSIAYQQSKEAFMLTQRAYQQGSADYLTVLIAERNLLDNQAALTESITACSLNLIALYKALAGGWHPEKILATEGGMR